jgi:hypothetical protein
MMDSSSSIGSQRRRLDQLYMIDAILSMSFGIVSLVIPHVLLIQFTGGGSYNHSVHETLRYGNKKSSVDP